MPLSRHLLLPLVLLGATGLAAQATGPAGTPDPRAILAKATQELEQTGQAQRAIHQGQRAPDFTLPDAKGGPVRLSELLKKGPVVLTFYRGGWCPFCNLQLKSYQAHLAQLRAAGAELVAVSPQTPDATATTAEKDALDFPVLSDMGNQVARSYGLVFRLPDAVVPIYRQFGIELEKANGDASHELPMPATYLIGRDGIVKLAQVEADYKKRMPIETLLEALRP